METGIDTALMLIATHFRGIADEDGVPYVEHCLRVAEGVTSPAAKQVALLHDLIEDTPVTLEQLTERGISSEVIQAVGLLTHDRSVSYQDYVIALKPNPLAREVKMSDLRDNSSLSRVLLREDRIEGDLRRIQRYILSYQFLQDRIDEATYRRRMSGLEHKA